MLCSLESSKVLFLPMFLVQVGALSLKRGEGKWISFASVAS